MPEVALGCKVDVKIDGTVVESTYFYSLKIYQKLFTQTKIILEIGYSGIDIHSFGQDAYKYLGKEMEINISDMEDESLSKKYKTIISELDVKFNSVILKAYSNDIKLTQGTKIRTFLKKQTNDIASELISEAGVSGAVSSASYKDYEYFLQYNESNWDCLKRLAFFSGNIMYHDCEQDKLIFTNDTSSGNKVLVDQSYIIDAGLECKIGVNDFVAKSYNPARNDKPGVFKSPVTSASQKNEFFDLSKSASKSVFGSSEENLYVELNNDNLQNAQITAKAMMNYSAGEKVKIYGQLNNIPNVTLGSIIKCDDIKVLSEDVFITEIVSVFEESSLNSEFVGIPAGALIKPEINNNLPMNQTLQIGLVTDNKDEEVLGRVKVKLNFWGDEVESYWARVATFGSGKEVGSYYTPRVGDQVLVGFEHGDVNHPIILGSLYHSEAKPSFVTENGTEETLLFRSGSGSEIRIDDTEGSERFEIIIKDGKGSMKMDASKPSLTIYVDNGTITLDTKDIVLKASNNITIEAKNKLEIKANDIEAGATKNLKISAGSKAELGALNTEVKASAQMKVSGGASTELSSSGSTAVKGSIVQIN